MADNTFSKMLESLTRLIAAEQNLDVAILNPSADLAVAAFQGLQTSATVSHTQVGCI